MVNIYKVPIHWEKGMVSLLLEQISMKNQVEKLTINVFHNMFITCLDLYIHSDKYIKV